MKACLDCGRLSAESRCESCGKEKRSAKEQGRPSAAARGYGASWQKRRREFLRYFPVCVDCGDEATVPDHDPHTRAELVEMGVPDPDAFEFLRPRCKPCHDRKTVRFDGGFGRATRDK